MEQQLVEQLIALNRAFYAQFASAFSETRASTQASLHTILTYISPGVKVLDVGCGNGRLAEGLERVGRRVTYVGVDSAAELIELAAARCAGLACVSVELRLADVTQAGWQASLPGPPFDVALALAVLHHIPSFRLRRDVLRSVRAVLKPGGRLVMSNWQFTHHERLRKKIVAWQSVGIDERQLEPGDALLDWRRGGTGYRYCHLLSEDEVGQLAAHSDFELLEQFYADAGLNLYSVLKACA